MRCPTLAELPPPPIGKAGWPWTMETPQNQKTMADVSWSKVSIVTPSFNQGCFIEETLRSVLLQGYPNLEFIVIDGGSTDNSTEIIQRYKTWLAYWTSERDYGQANAINKGFQRSTGEIMEWINSDDCLLPGAVWQVAKTFRRLPASHIVCGFRYVIDAESKRLDYEVYPRPDRFSLSRGCFLPQETVFWRRSLWEQVGEIDESYHYALDYEFWQRILAAGYQFYLIPRFMGAYRVHTFAKTAKQLDVRSREIARIYQQYLHTSRSEAEVLNEIGRGWWRRMYVLNRLARLGLFRFSWLADLLVNLISLTRTGKE